MDTCEPCFTTTGSLRGAKASKHVMDSCYKSNFLGLLPFTTSFVNFHHFIRANYLKVKFEHVRACWGDLM